MSASHPLAQLRTSRGWSQADLARRIADAAGVNMASHRQKVYRWENGAVVPDLPTQHALAHVLGVDRELVDACGWPGWLCADTLPGDWTPQTAQTALAQVVESACMDRRAFLALSGNTLAAAALHNIPEPVAAAAGGGTAGGEVVTGLAARLEHLWHLDDLLGGGACLPAAVADLRLANQVLSRASYRGCTEQGLFSVAAQLGRFAGWAAFDAGQQAAAQRFWAAGLRCAHAAGDSTQAAYILSNLALQSIYVEAGRSAVDQLDAARAMVDPAARTVHAMLDCWQARAHATRGEHRQAAQMLNRADTTWGNRRAEDDPPWIYWMPLPSDTSEAATALMDMGEHARAQRQLTAGMAGLAPDAARDRNLYLTRLAELGVATGDLDQAADHAHAAIDAAAGIDSRRVADRVMAMVSRFPAGEPVTVALRRHATDAAVTSLP